jgi:hypothetical protein
MTAQSRVDGVDRRERAIGLRILTIGAAIELLVFSWLVAQGRPAFMAFVWTPDTPGYYRVAEPLAREFTLIGGHRTLGYPVVLALAEVIGGAGNGHYLVILLQLVLNLGFTWGCWRLLLRLAPDTRVSLRASATAVFFLAGLGMACLLMTDFIAAAFFALFLYGMLFWRTRAAVLLSGLGLAFATLTRPSFTFIPVLLPAFAYCIRRVTSSLPAIHVLGLAALSVCATGVSVAYQYAYNGYLGPSPILILQIRETIYYGIEKGRGSDSEFAAFVERFERRIERRAGRPYAGLSLSEQEGHARAIFREEAAAHPGAVVAAVLRNFVKYLFVPVESIVMRFALSYLSRDAYAAYVRPLLALGFLPIWLLALAPPVRSSDSRKMYYALMWVCVLCLVGFGAITTGSGERIRFPVLAFMLPVMVWNAQSLQTRLRAGIGAWRVMPNASVRSV